MLVVTMFGEGVFGGFSTIGYIDSFDDEQMVLKHIKERYNLTCKIDVRCRTLGVRTYHTDRSDVRVIIEVVNKL